MTKKQKLELTWIGKENRPKLEPRILLEDAEKSSHAAHRVTESDIFDNRLSFGDNLLALKVPEAEFAGKVRCVSIDSSNNTGSVFTRYDDGGGRWCSENEAGRQAEKRERAAVHSETPMTDKRIYIIAGPNGTGKTTFAREFLPNEAECPVFVNVDLIAAGLSPFAPELAAVKAGRLMLESIGEHASRGDSFAFETTLSGLGYARRIPHWRAEGYHVTLFFLALPSAEMAIARVAERVRQGGHAVSDAVVRRRFVSGRRQFEDIYRNLVDAWMRMTTAARCRC